MSKFDVEAVRREFTRNERYYSQVVSEVSHTVSSLISLTNIKIHNVTGRVKTIDSLLNKASDKNLSDPLSEATDICGIRIVCLFRADLSDIEGIIRSNFEVLSSDDKISSSDGFGYMSIHYICRLKDSFNGPRYDNIKDFVFEIQTRTLCMDAWAAISHYLDYKGQWDVPEELKKSMNALSGLFYVADNEFQHVYRSKQQGSDKALQDIHDNDTKDIPINFDTMMAYIEEKFPDRPFEPASLSALVQQVTECGFNTIGDIDEKVNNASKLFKRYESRRPSSSGGGKYNGIGAVRMSLSIANDAMDEHRRRNLKHNYVDEALEQLKGEYKSIHNK